MRKLARTATLLAALVAAGPAAGAGAPPAPAGAPVLALRAQLATLGEWRAAVDAQYGGVFRALALRLESRLIGAVEEVYREYAAQMAQQHDRMTQDLAVRVEQPRPHTHLRLTEAGLEMTIRFPVPLERATEIDDRMTRAFVAAVGREPRLKLAGSATPMLQAVPAPA